jgi:Tn3 transposase DDE domain
LATDTAFTLVQDALDWLRSRKVIPPALQTLETMARKGSISDRTRLEQDIHAMALNLVVAAITLWNTAYLDRALQGMAKRGTPVPEIYLPHISPLGWEHIGITGTYTWRGSTKPWGRFRPLRVVESRQERCIA